MHINDTVIYFDPLTADQPITQSDAGDTSGDATGTQVGTQIHLIIHLQLLSRSARLMHILKCHFQSAFNRS